MWRPQPENNLLTQQSKVSGGYYSDGTLRETDLAQLAQACRVEGDTVNLTGTLRQQGDGESAYWTLTPDSPLPACAMPISSSGWNQTMQLVLTPQERESLNNLVGKKSASAAIFFWR